MKQRRMCNSIVFYPGEYSSVWEAKTTLTRHFLLKCLGQAWKMSGHEQYLCVGDIGFALFYIFFYWMLDSVCFPFILL